MLWPKITICWMKSTQNLVKRMPNLFVIFNPVHLFYVHIHIHPRLFQLVHILLQLKYFDRQKKFIESLFLKSTLAKSSAMSSPKSMLFLAARYLSKYYWDSFISLIELHVILGCKIFVKIYLILQSIRSLIEVQQSNPSPWLCDK